ncbi:MAG: UDP-N-acetylglucosamine 2-epimerase (hydrolyzing), partial [Actinobacteria bacterium]|nr:UDP-N-acetylglucosamine 2-epimerase (hydrolyzing) [Actinomycetota bacterium]
NFFEVKIITTGMHLSPEFGLTYKEIEKDGLAIDEKIEILLSSDTPVGISKAMGLGMISFSEAYERLKPDLIIGLGDRFELFSSVAAAMVSRIPVAHLHGGESTEGAIDEPMRHAITKMSHIHFTSTEFYRKRVIQLGENPLTVFNVGAIGLDNLKNLKLLTKKQLEKELNFNFGEKNIIFTFHPITLEKDTSLNHITEIFKALDRFKDIKIIFTKGNADTGGRIINELIENFVIKNPGRSVVFTSLGQLRYLSTLQFVDAIVGNSSSGIIEMPSFKKATINIGDRQRGRIKASSVIDCYPKEKDIVDAINKVYDDEFQKALKKVINPYWQGGATEIIIDKLKTIELSNILKKQFYDIQSSTPS